MPERLMWQQWLNSTFNISFASLVSVPESERNPPWVTRRLRGWSKFRNWEINCRDEWTLYFLQHLLNCFYNCLFSIYIVIVSLLLSIQSIVFFTEGVIWRTSKCTVFPWRSKSKVNRDWDPYQGYFFFYISHNLPMISCNLKPRLWSSQPQAYI